MKEGEGREKKHSDRGKGTGKVPKPVGKESGMRRNWKEKMCRWYTMVLHGTHVVVLTR